MIRLPASPVFRIAFWMLVSAVAFGGLMGIVRHLGAHANDGDGLHVFVISFWRFVFGLLFFLPTFLRRGPSAFQTNRWGMHTVRALFLIASSIALMNAILLMPLDEATALSFTTPLFTVIGAILILGEKAGPRRWAALVIGFLGVLIILRPGEEIISWGAFYVLFSAVTFAGVVICGKVLVRTDSPELLVATIALICVPLSLVPALIYWQWPAIDQFVWLVGAAICSNLNMYGIAKALQSGDTTATQPYDFLRLPTTAGVGWIAFGEQSDVFTWVGALVIFSSSIYITRREALATRAERAAAESNQVVD